MDSTLTYTTRSTCRICGSKHFEKVLSLGLHYVNGFVEPGLAYRGLKCPIELVYCQECTLVQNPHTAPQELLYSGHYWYKSGTTDTMRAALADVVKSVQAEVDLSPSDIVLDIGSNDGTLLREYNADLGLLRVGVEPAKNLFLEGSEGIDIFINDFWSYEVLTSRFCFHDESPVKAKIITACGMFYDLEDPNSFIADIKQALHPDGVFLAQLMCLKNMLNVSDFGNLAHEHLEFYTLQSLEVLLNRHELEIYKIETNEVNGQSYRLFIQHRRGPRPTDISVPQTRINEKGILNELTKFWTLMEMNKTRILEFINQERRKGKRFWVYGASTKGNTILQYLRLTDWEVYGAADKDSTKWGRVTVGSNIMILPEETMRKHKPDYCIVLPFAFRDEFINREANEEWRLSGGKFLFPLPKLEVV